MESPVDRHATFDQVFWVIEGEGELTIGTERALVGPQTVAFIPRDTPHSIKCVSGGLKYLYLNVWGKGVPESERLWRRVYLNVHARRTAAAPDRTPE
jgi:mannose-6-phosphate isomerase-like protein (cupin superfamily)